MKKNFIIRKYRSFSAVIEDSFGFFKIYGKDILKIVWKQNRIIVVALVFFYFLYVYSYLGKINNFFDVSRQHTGIGDYESIFLTFFIILLIILIPRLFAGIAGYLKTYDDDTGKVDEKEIKKMVKKKFWGLIGLTLAIGFFNFIFFFILALFSAAFGILGGEIGIFLFFFIYFFLIVSSVLYFSLSYYIYFFENQDVLSAIFGTTKYLKGKFWYSLGIFVLMVIITFLLRIVMYAPQAIYFLLKYILMLDKNDMSAYTGEGELIMTIISLFLFIGQLILWLLMVIFLAFLYFSIHEYHTGESLFKKINKIGIRENETGN